MNDEPQVPKNERQHFVPQWILRGFTDFEGKLHALRVSEQRPFTTGPRGVFAATNINTAFSEDGRTLLAYSEDAYGWLDHHGSRTAFAIRDAAREAVWRPRKARVVVAADPKILTWFTGLLLLHILRSPDSRRLAEEVADQFDLTNDQRQVLKVAFSARGRLQKTEDYLNIGRPTVLRATPDDPLIVGDDIMVRGSPTEDGKPSVIGILIDQHTILGRCFVHDGRPKLGPGDVEVFELTARDVEQLNGQIASRAETIAGSRRSLVDRIGKTESAQRKATTKPVSAQQQAL